MRVMADQVHNVQQKPALEICGNSRTSTNYSCLAQADVSTSHQNINQMADWNFRSTIRASNRKEMLP